jgi:SpoVK/Ycf46/Vps4 family AAA+-type ATPase
LQNLCSPPPLFFPFLFSFSLVTDLVVVVIHYLFTAQTAVNDVSAAATAEVEPLTSDDWELIQLNAGVIEQSLLQQINVVTAQSVFPFWIRDRLLIKLCLKSPAPSGFVKLGLLSEVAVAPKPRSQRLADSTASQLSEIFSELKQQEHPPEHKVNTDTDADNDDSDDCGLHEASSRLKQHKALPKKPLPCRFRVMDEQLIPNPDAEEEKQRLIPDPAFVYVSPSSAAQLGTKSGLVRLNFLQREDWAQHATQEQSFSPVPSAGAAVAASSSAASSADDSLCAPKLVQSSWICSIAVHDSCVDGHVLVPHLLRSALFMPAYSSCWITPLHAATTTIQCKVARRITIRPITLVQHAATSGALEQIQAALTDSYDINALLCHWARVQCQEGRRYVYFCDGQVISIPQPETASDSAATSAVTHNAIAVSLWGGDRSSTVDSSHSASSHESGGQHPRTRISMRLNASPIVFRLDLQHARRRFHIAGTRQRQATQAQSMNSSGTGADNGESDNDSDSDGQQSFPDVHGSGVDIHVDLLGTTVTLLADTRLPHAIPTDRTLTFPPSMVEHGVSNTVSSHTGAAVAKSCSPMKLLHQLGGMDTAIQQALDHVSANLSSSFSPVHSILGTSAGGMLLIAGASGCGKSSLARALMHYAHQERSIMAHTEWIPCADWMTVDLETLRSRLNRICRRAIVLAPSIVVFDDLDALLPETTEQNFGLFARVANICELLCDLLSKAVHARRSRSQPVKVSFIATAKAKSKLAGGIQLPGLFDTPMTLESPDADGRIAILKLLLQSLSLHCAQHIDLMEVAQQTEGFVGHDLSQLVERCVHLVSCEQSECQIADVAIAASDSASASASGSVLAASIDNRAFTLALDGFVPLALRNVDLESSSVAWADIGGLWTVKSTLKETLELPARYARLFDAVPLKLRSGLLLYGPPGCGKTLLACAVARECGLNFVSVKGPELLNKYIGASEQSVRDVFDRAAAAAPCVIFFDEFEAIAPARGGDRTGVTDRVVNQFLCHLDGVEARAGVYVLAASSRPDLIDPALLRPGRLDKALFCGFPDSKERMDILMALSRNSKLAADVDFAPVVERTEHYSGADLQGIFTNSQLLAVHDAIDSARKAAAGDGGGDDDDGKNGQMTELVATQQHLMQALTDSAPSVSPDERSKFAKIYEKFVRSRQDQDTAFDKDGTQRQCQA